MSKAKDGGPAFPRPASDDRTQGDQPDGNRTVGPQDGMTLRDWFAGQVISSIAPAVPVVEASKVHEFIPCLADVAYLIADAMLAARTKESL